MSVGSSVSQLVYVVDDDPGIRDAVSLLIQSHGFECSAFGSVEDFLADFDPERLACLVLDLQLPRQTGLDLQQELLRRGAGLPIVFITGYGDISTAVRAMRGGAVDFLEKPFDESLLIQRVQEALAKAVTSREIRDARSKVETLTDREREVIDFVTNGLSTKEIAAELHRSEKTIEGHRRNIMRKLQAESVADVVRIATTARREENGDDVRIEAS